MLSTIIVCEYIIVPLWLFSQQMVGNPSNDQPMTIVIKPVHCLLQVNASIDAKYFLPGQASKVQGRRTQA